MKLSFEKINPDSGSSFKVINWNASNDRFFWHQHPEYEIIWIKKGSGKRQVGNHRSEYKQGEVMFLGPDLPHTGMGYGATDLHEEVIIQLNQDFLGDQFWHSPEMQEARKMFEKAKLGISFNGKARKGIARKMNTLDKKSQLQKLITLLEIFVIIAHTEEYSILNDDHTNFDFYHKNEDRFSKIFDFVRSNYLKPVILEEIAEEVNLTVPSFCRYFKKMTQQTYTEFVNEYRINEACKLLQEGKNVTEVCYESGFNNLSHFNKSFKKYRKINPKDYRKQAIPQQ